MTTKAKKDNVKVKIKTLSSLKGRFKRTKSGLILSKPCGLRHGMTKRNQKRLTKKRQLKVLRLGRRMQRALRSVTL